MNLPTATLGRRQPEGNREKGWCWARRPDGSGRMQSAAHLAGLTLHQSSTARHSVGAAMKTDLLRWPPRSHSRLACGFPQPRRTGPQPQGSTLLQWLCLGPAHWSGEAGRLILARSLWRKSRHGCDSRQCCGLGTAVGNERSFKASPSPPGLDGADNGLPFRLACSWPSAKSRGARCRQASQSFFTCHINERGNDEWREGKLTNLSQIQGHISLCGRSTAVNI